MRADGYYWLFDSNDRPLVARYDGGFWTFIGSVFLLNEDDDDDAEELADYKVGPMITPPVL